MSLEQCLAHEKELPPVFESSWESHQKLTLHSVVAMAYGGTNFTVLTLYKKVKALSVGRFIISSIHSRLTTSCTVMVYHPSQPNELHLA